MSHNVLHVFLKWQLWQWISKSKSRIKKVKIAYAIFPNHQRSPFCTAVFQRRSSLSSSGIPASRNRKIVANPHATIFLQINKGEKTRAVQKPLPPAHHKLLRLSAFWNRWEYANQPAKRNSIRLHGGFSVYRSCKQLFPKTQQHISDGLRFGFASPTFQPAVIQK